jgi:hypothetical protein
MSKFSSSFSTIDILAIIGGLTCFLIFMLISGFIIQNGVVPVFEYLDSLVSLSAYQKGIFDVLFLEFIVLVLFYVMRDTRMRTV